MGKNGIGTPYDDVFRTLLNDCTQLIIPVVNEIFGEHYTGEETVWFLPNEHFINRQDANTQEKITDSCFIIKGIENKKYHIECQSTEDKEMQVRFFEYDAQIALDDKEMEKDKMILTFPHSAALYLRHTRNAPDALTLEIRTPGGTVSYKIPVLKAQRYTSDEIFDKNLLFLIPFYIFSYESRFMEIEENEEKLQELRREYSDIKARLEHLCLEGKISEYVKCTLIDMSKKVVREIASKYEKVRKEVTSVMGGKILEYEAKTILKRGILEGRIEGRMEAYIGLIKDGILSISEAAKRLDMKEEELKKYL